MFGSLATVYHGLYIGGWVGVPGVHPGGIPLLYGSVPYVDQYPVYQHHRLAWYRQPSRVPLLGIDNW